MNRGLRSSFARPEHGPGTSGARPSFTGPGADPVGAFQDRDPSDDRPSLRGFQEDMGIKRTDPDTALVGRVLEGELSAFGSLMERHKEKVLRLVARHVPPTEVEEIMQEVFVRTYRSLAGFRPESSFSGWISTIAVRTCYDYWRRAGRNREVPESALGERHRRWIQEVIRADAEEDFESMARRQEAQEVLDWALGRLSAQDRMVVELVYLEEMPVREAARLLGWTTANVKVRAYRCKRKLRRLLGERGEETAS